MSIDVERLQAACASVRIDPARLQACLAEMTDEELLDFHETVSTEALARRLR